MRRCRKCKLEYGDEVLFCEKCKSAMPKISFCSACGGKMLGTGELCELCKKELNIQLTKSLADGNTSDKISENKKEPNDSSGSVNLVSLSESEILVKMYHCTTLKRPSIEGYLTITNKRVVFHGHGFSGGGKNRLVSEFPIEDVSGISSYYGTGLKLNFIALGILSSLLFFFFVIMAFSVD